MTGRESLQGLVLPGQWPLRAPQAALPEHPLLSLGWAGGGDGGLLSGAAHPLCSVPPLSGSAPAQTRCGQGLVLGCPRCFPPSQTSAKGLPQPSRALCAAAPAPSEGACPAVVSPSWQHPACHTSGSSRTGKAPGSTKGGDTLIPMPAGTASPCCTPSLGRPAVGAAGWAQPLRAHCPESLAEPWCCLICMMVPCIRPSPAPRTARCCSPALARSPHPPGGGILASSILQHWALASAPCLTQCHPQPDPESSPAPSPVPRAGRHSAGQAPALVLRALGLCVASHGGG